MRGRAVFRISCFARSTRRELMCDSMLTPVCFLNCRSRYTGCSFMLSATSLLEMPFEYSFSINFIALLMM